jgi:hypothetical protein
MHFQRIKRHGDISTKIKRYGGDPCYVSGCDRKISSKGYCEMHYKRFKTWGDPLLTKYIPPLKNRPCGVEGCTRKYSSRGYCKTHLYRADMYGDPLKLSMVKNVGCKIDGCDKKHSGKGYCVMHLYRFNKYGDPYYTKVNTSPPEKCTARGCDMPHISKGYCAKHYHRFWKHGDPNISLRNVNPPEVCTVEDCNRPHKSKGLCNTHRLRKSYLKKAKLAWTRNSLLNIFTRKDWKYCTPGKQWVTDKMLATVEKERGANPSLLSMPHQGRELDAYMQTLGLNKPESLGIENDLWTFNSIKNFILKQFGIKIERGHIDDKIMEMIKPKFDVAHLDYNGPMIYRHVDPIIKMVESNALTFVTVQQNDIYGKDGIDMKPQDFGFKVVGDWEYTGLKSTGFPKGSPMRTFGLIAS